MAYTPEQLRNIQLALHLSKPYAPRIRRALLEAMGVESNFRQLKYGDRDSVGVLQQRPSQGWGPASETAAQDIAQFLSRAVRNNRGFSGTAGQLAQSVQRSAFPGRYDQRRAQVDALLAHSGGGGYLSMPTGIKQIIPGVPSTGGGNRAALRAFVSANLASFAATGKVDPAAGTNLLMAMQSPQQGPNQSQDRPALAGLTPHSVPGAGKGRINELFYDPLGALKFDKRIKAVGGHGDHVHVALSTLAAQIAAENQGRRMGLRVSEEQDRDVHPVHVSGSYHYRRFPNSRYRQAADLSGSANQMAAFYRWVAARY